MGGVTRLMLLKNPPAVEPCPKYLLPHGAALSANPTVSIEGDADASVMT